MEIAAPYNTTKPNLSGNDCLNFKIAPVFIRLFTFKEYCALNDIITPKAKHYKSYINERNNIFRQYLYKYQWYNSIGKCIGETFEPNYTLREIDKGTITCKIILKWIN